MVTFTGVSASPGVVIGPVELLDHGSAGLHRIVCDPFRERALYDVAVVLAKDELRRLSQRAKGPDADILLFQIALLEDESFTNEIGDYIAAGAGGAAAVERAEQIFAKRLRDVDDEYIRERSVDVCDVCQRVVDILDGRPRRRLCLKRPSILVADRFFPSDLFSIDRRMVLGLASDQDSTVSHAAIMARGLGIPSVVQLGAGVAARAAGHRAILDAENGTGRLVIEPDGAQLAETDCKIALRRLHGRAPDPVAALPCLTKDGTAFRLLVSDNISPNARAGQLLPQGAAGIGLLRTESLILENISEEEQTELLQSRLRQLDGALLAVRSCDPYVDDDAPWAGEVRERLQGHRLYWPLVRAVLRCGGAGDLRLLFPQLDGVAAWDACCREVNACRAQLQDTGIDVVLPPLGCIVDMPSAAVMAADLIEHGAQLLAIDIEDLTRYTLGLTDAAEAPTRIAEPAVQRLVRLVLDAAQAHGVTVYLCGITVENYTALPAYLQLGIRNFCTEPAALLPLKKLLMEQTLA